MEANVCSCPLAYLDKSICLAKYLVSSCIVVDIAEFFVAERKWGT